MREIKIWKGVQFYTDEIKKAGIKDKIPDFNDILTGKTPPKQSIQPLFKNIKLDGKDTDIYHFGGSSARVYLHIKE